MFIIKTLHLVSMAAAFKYGPLLNMWRSYPAHLRGTCLIGFNYNCLWSSLKRSKKGSVANADPHGFLHTLCAFSPVHACTQSHTHIYATHPIPHTGALSPTHTNTHITPPTVRLQIANQGHSIDLKTTVRQTQKEKKTPWERDRKVCF